MKITSTTDFPNQNRSFSQISQQNLQINLQEQLNIIRQKCKNEKDISTTELTRLNNSLIAQGLPIDLRLQALKILEVVAYNQGLSGQSLIS